MFRARPRLFAPALLQVLVVVLISLLLVSPTFAGPRKARTAVSPSAAASNGPTAAPGVPPRVWLTPSKSLSPSYTGDAVARSVLASGSVQALSLAYADFNGDGLPDLVAGYTSAQGVHVIAIHSGNLNAYVPQSRASFDAIGQGIFPPAFLANAGAIAVPIRPDFVATGDLNGDGHMDIVIGSRADAALFVLLGDGKGNFPTSFTLSLTAPVTALSATRIHAADRFSTLLVGLATRKPLLAVYTGTESGIAPVSSYSLPGTVTSVAFGSLYRSGYTDAALLAGGQLFILRGTDLHAALLGNTGSKPESISLGLTGVALDIGMFINDRDGRQQIAVLGADGAVNFVTRSGIDTRPWTPAEWTAMRQGLPRGKNPPLPPVNASEGWAVTERVSSVVGSASSTHPPSFIATRVSGNAMDDVVVFDTTGQLHQISHANVRQPSELVNGLPPSAHSILAAGSSQPVAAIKMRVGFQARPGLVTLQSGQAAPSQITPLPDPTFTVNRFDDPTPAAVGTNCLGVADDCSLREAVIEANAATGADTIMLPAGTYTLSIANDPITGHAYDASNGALDVNDGLDIQGAGASSTIIQAGTDITNGVDEIFLFNWNLNPSFDASLTGLTLRFGRNTSNVFAYPYGGAFVFDAGANGSGHLTVTNCVIDHNSVIMQTSAGDVADGGGFAVFNEFPGSGGAIVTGTTVSNNNAGDIGGGILVGSGMPLLLANSVVTGNVLLDYGVGHGAKQGGGIYAYGPVALHGTGVSNNTAISDGGGIFSTNTTVMDQASNISGNTSGGNGGGVWVNTDSTASPAQSVSISSSAFTGNSAGGTGGAIQVDSASNNFTMHYSRIAGNTAAGGGSGLNAVAGTVNVASNWWGTNAPSDVIQNGGAALTFDPFIVLTHSANPAKIRINQSTSLTGALNSDNHGNVTGTAPIDLRVGLPITFDNPVLGTITQAQPETLDAVAQANATFNAGGTSGFGSANATVDQAVVPVNSNLIASATESSATVTITTVGAHGFSTGEQVTVAGVWGGGYNGTFIIASTPSPTSFTYTTAAGLGSSSGGTATVGIIILEPPSIVMSFNPTTVAINGVSTITFSITNSNVVPIDASFTDTFPANLVVAAGGPATNNCLGTFSPVAGASSVTYSNPAFSVGTCTVTVAVSSAIDNIYSNSVTINSSDAGNGGASSATLTVINPPSIVKSFAFAPGGTIPLNATFGLTFTVTSSNANLTLNGVAFTDTLPSGVVTATPGYVGTTCNGSTPVGPGLPSVELSGASLAPGASCRIDVNVTGTTPGVKNNSVQVSALTSGTGNTSSASVTVVAPPVIIKAFGAANIPLNGTTSLTFTIQNNNTGSIIPHLDGIAFTDTLPAGLVISTPNGFTGADCQGGTITATAGSNVISLTGGSIFPSSACIFSVNVTGTAAGQQNNTTGSVTSTEGGTGGTASASVIVVAPPSIAKAFNPTVIALSGTTTLTFTITNPAANTVGEQQVIFTDTLPTGLTVAAGSTSVCGGVNNLQVSGQNINLFATFIAVNSACQFSVTVTGAASGQYTNTTGAVSSTNGGTGNTASANLTVASPPTITKAFGAAQIPFGAATSLTFTIQNVNTNVTLNSIAFTDSLPAGLVVATPNNLSSTCGGTAVAVAGATPASLSGVTLAASASCTVSLNVQGTTAGVKNNSVQVTSTEGGTGNTSNASITVVKADTTTAATSSANPAVFGQPVTFTATVTPVAPGAGTPTGTVTFLADGNSFGTATLSGGVATVTATAPAVGSYTITTTYTGDANFNSSTGSLTGNPIVFNKANSTTVVTSSQNPSAFGEGVTFTATITAVAPGSSISTGTVTFLDGGSPIGTGTLMSNTGGVAFATFTTSALAVGNHTITTSYGGDATVNGSNGSLTGNPQVVNKANTTTTMTSSPNPSIFGQSVTFTATVALSGPGAGTPTGTVGFYLNGMGTPIGTGTLAGGVATFTTSALPVGSNTITANYNGDGNFSISTAAQWNLQVNKANTSTAVISSLNPSALGQAVLFTATVSPVAPGSGTPTGSVTFLANGTSIGTAPLVGGVASFITSALASGSNTITTSYSADANFNSSAGSMTGNPQLVIAPPVIIKAFGAASVPLGGSTSLSFTTQNNNASATLTGVGFSDTLPAGLVISTPSGLTAGCGGGSMTAVPGTNVISLIGKILAPSSSCTFSVNVTGTAAGQQNNTTGAVVSNEGGTGGTASASLQVVAPPFIQKAFGNCTVPPTGMVGWWAGDGNANDISGNANNGTLQNGAGFATGEVAQAFNLNGTGQYVQIDDPSANAAFDVPTAFTLDAWVYQNAVDGNGRMIIFKTQNVGNSASYSLSLNGTGKVVLEIDKQSVGHYGVWTTTAGVSGGVWRHIAATWQNLRGDSTDATIYIDGVAQTTSFNSLGYDSGATLEYTNLPLLIGKDYAGNFYFNGLIDEAEVFNRVLNPNEIGFIYNAGSNGKCKGTQGIALNGTAPLTFTITDPSANPVDETGVAFTDTLPTGLLVSTPNSLSSTCGGTATATAGGTSISLSGGDVATNTSCTVVVNVTGTTSGEYVNVTGAVSATNGGTGNTATANVSVASPPTISKAFGAATIPLNGTTSLTFTITNPNTAITLTGIAFTDNLPAGLVIATPGNLSSTCSGSASAADGASSASLSGASLAPSSSCTVSVTVQGIPVVGVPLVKNNSVQISSTNGGIGNTSNASITVVYPPDIRKFFGATSSPLNQATSLSFTVTNSLNFIPLTGVGFTDVLPAGLVVAPNLSSVNCGSGSSATFTAVAGTNSISMSGGTLAVGGQCVFLVYVTGTAAGVMSNITGAVTSNEGGTGGTASATLLVEGPPVIAMAFNPTVIPLSGTATLTVTVTNPPANPQNLTGVSFVDSLPTGLLVATPNGLSTTCNVFPQAPAGGTVIGLTLATIMANSSCTVVVNVTGTAAGQYTNTIGAVGSSNGGSGASTSANLTVASPPTITKVFGASTIPLNGTSSLTFTIQNPNSNIALTFIAFNDNLPAGLVVATPNNLSNTCGGTATAIGGSGNVALSSVTLAASATCTVSVNVQGSAAGVKNNSVNVNSTEGGTGNTSNASITVVAPPVIIKAFGAASIQLGTSTSLTFTFTNPNTTVALTGVAVMDTLPTGLAYVLTPVGGTCSNTGTGGAGTITISGITLGSSSSCTVIANVTAIAAGTQVNTTGAVTSTEGGTGGTATASVDVPAPDLTVTASHAGSFRQGDASDSYTITVSNAGTGKTLGTVSVVDTLPASLTVVSMSGSGWTCTPATKTCTRSDALAAAASYPAVALVVSVANNAPPSVTETATVSGGGEINTSNDVASDPTTVIQVADMVGVSTHSGHLVQTEVGATYTLTVSNSGPGPTVGTVTAVDTLPSSLTATAISGTGWTCTLATLTCTRSDALAAGGSYPPITLTVTVGASTPASVINTLTVSGGSELNTANDVSTDATVVDVPAVTITPNPATLSLPAGMSGTATLTFVANVAFSNQATITCTSSINLSTCTATPSSVAVGTSSSTSLITITTTGPNHAMNLIPAFPGRGAGTALAALFLGLPAVVLVGPWRRKANARKRAFWLTVVGLVMMFAMVACGSAPETRAGTYTVTFTASVTGAAGTTTASVPITVTVTH